MSPSSAHPGHPGAVLGEQLAAAAGQPVSRPGKQVDRPAAVSGAVVLARGADGEVEEAIAIEVASAERQADLVIRLDHP